MGIIRTTAGHAGRRRRSAGATDGATDRPWRAEIVSFDNEHEGNAKDWHWGWKWPTRWPERPTIERQTKWDNGEREGMDVELVLLLVEGELSSVGGNEEGFGGVMEQEETLLLMTDTHLPLGVVGVAMLAADDLARTTAGG